MTRRGTLHVRATLLLLSMTVAACGGGGGAAPPPQPTATPRPTPVPALAAEEAAGVAVSMVIGLVVLADQNPTADVEGGAANARSLGPTAGVARSNALVLTVAAARPLMGGDGGGAAVRTCTRGGTIDSSCAESGNSSTVTASFTNCGLVAPRSGNTLTASGGLVVTVAARGVCSTGVLPQNVLTTVKVTNFSGTEKDQHGGIVERVSGSFTETFDPRSEGCAGGNGTATFDGTLGDAVNDGAIDVSLVARHLALDLQSSGTPCVQQIIADGGLDITDHVIARRFASTLHGLTVTAQDGASDALTATIDGLVDTDCLGSVTFQTLTTLYFANPTDCPSTGKLAVTRADGLNARVDFIAGGDLAFDFDADGLAEKMVGSCADAAQCM